MATNSRLSKEWQKKAREELNETPDSIEMASEELWQKISYENNFYFPDHTLLLRFLRVSKFDVDMAFDRIIKYYKTAQKYPKDWNSLRLSQVNYEILFEDEVFKIMDGFSSIDGSKVIYIDIGKWNVKKYDYDTFINAVWFAMEYLLETFEEIQIGGVTFLENMEGFTLKHLRHMGLPSVLKGIGVFAGALPFRIKGIHIVKVNKLSIMFFNLIRPMLPKKLADRLFLYEPNSEKIFENVGRSCVPVHLGGEVENLSYDNHLDSMREFEKFWLPRLKYGYQEGESDDKTLHIKN